VWVLCERAEVLAAGDGVVVFGIEVLGTMAQVTGFKVISSLEALIR
jgi:hypothetical protein